MKVAFVGPLGNTHLCGSFHRAAQDIGLESVAIDTARAYEGPVVLRKLAWHMADRRPLRMRQFSQDLSLAFGDRLPDVVLTLGQAPVNGDAISVLQQAGIICANFSTDDPFNKVVGAGWHLEDLKRYNHIFTPRRANFDQLTKLGSARVHYLPFGYDPHLFQPVREEKQTLELKAPQVLFVGGADADRAAFFAEFIDNGPPPTLVGGYWDRYDHTRHLTLGMQEAAAIQALTASAGVNICLVRRANRDGHVMRSFEIPAVGGFLMAEDTIEHREIFGHEGERVMYFASAHEAAVKSARMLKQPAERKRMSAALQQYVTASGHTYADRLRWLLAACTE
jgi:spore maturation protein CgeB